MSWIKLNQIEHGIFAALVVLAMFFASLSIPLSGQVGTITIKGQGTRAATPAEELFSTLIFVFVVIVGGEAVRAWVKQAFALDESKFSTAPATGWGQAERGLLLKSMIGTSFWVLLVLGLVIAFLYFLIRNIATHAGPLPWSFWLIVFIYVFYVVIRRPLLAAGGRVIGSTLASYRVNGDTITLDLKRRRAPPPGKRPFIGLATVPCFVTIRFEELDEVRAFTYVEAQAYGQCEVGPDAKAALGSVTELYRYLNGEIERPSVYSHWDSMGTVLLLRGPELFYEVSVSNKDVNDLVAAFRESRASAAHMTPAPA